MVRGSTYLGISNGLRVPPGTGWEFAPNKNGITAAAASQVEKAGWRFIFLGNLIILEWKVEKHSEKCLYKVFRGCLRKDNTSRSQESAPFCIRAYSTSNKSMSFEAERERGSVLAETREEDRGACAVPRRRSTNPFIRCQLAYLAQSRLFGRDFRFVSVCREQRKAESKSKNTGLRHEIAVPSEPVARRMPPGHERGNRQELYSLPNVEGT